MNALFGLNHVEIGGRKRPIKFGTNQSAIYCQLRQCTLATYLMDLNADKLLNKEHDGTGIRDLIYSALAAGAMSAKESVDFTHIEVGDWIDEMEQSELTKIFKLMSGQNSPNGQGASDAPKLTETKN